MDSNATILSVLVAAVTFSVLVYSNSRARSTRSRAGEQATLDARADIKHLIEQLEVSARSILKQAERDAETMRKEAVIEAREKAHAVAAEFDMAAGRRHHPRHGLDQGRFAGAVVAQQTMDFAGIGLDRHIVECEIIAEAAGDAAQRH